MKELKTIKDYQRRISTMEDFMTYLEWVVGETLRIANEEWKFEIAIDYLEHNYVCWDDLQFELMEEYEDNEDKYEIVLKCNWKTIVLDE